MLRIGWFSTGHGNGSLGLLKEVQQSIENGELNASIEFVFINREFGEKQGSDNFIQLVKDYQIPLVTLSSTRFAQRVDGSFNKNRSTYDQLVLNLLKKFSVDLCVMAGYMLIISPEFCNQFKFINVHPALPGGPTGKWQDVIWELIDTKAKETGIMVHLVTKTVDEGAPISYCSFPIIGGKYDSLWSKIEGKLTNYIKRSEGVQNPLFKTIRDNGMIMERPLILETLIGVESGTININADKLNLSGSSLPKLMNRLIEDRLNKKRN